VNYIKDAHNYITINHEITRIFADDI